MGQLIVCATPGGVLIASDSKTVSFAPDGEEQHLTVDRLMPVTSHIVLASAGALEAHDLCRDFAIFAQEEGLSDTDALIEAAVPYFTGRYDEIMRKMCEKLPLDPVINMYLVVAGYSPKTPDNPSRLFVIWDRPQPPKIEYNRVTHIFTLPRRLGLEFRLNQLLQQKAPLSHVVEVAKVGLEKLAGQDEYIGPPYRFLTITAQGVAEV
jgi:hypothetical protein